MLGLLGLFKTDDNGYIKVRRQFWKTYSFWNKSACLYNHGCFITDKRYQMERKTILRAMWFQYTYMSVEWGVCRWRFQISDFLLVCSADNSGVRRYVYVRLKQVEYRFFYRPEFSAAGPKKQRLFILMRERKILASIVQVKISKISFLDVWAGRW